MIKFILCLMTSGVVFHLSAQTIRFRDGHILRNHQLVKEDLWVQDGKIVQEISSSDHEIDVTGKILAPGFIDIQLNGAFGVDFSSDSSEIDQVAKKLTRFGVTAFCPTMVTSKPEIYRKNLPYLQPHSVEKGATVLGAHMEGPFMHTSMCGAHDADSMLTCENGLSDALATYGTLEGIKIVTLAPELPGGLKLARELSEQGIVVAAGHSVADTECSLLAIEAGVTLVTHLFNRMAPLHHRNPGLAGVALTHDQLYFTLILDGYHLHPEVVKLAWRSNPNGVVIFTDGMAAMGLDEGQYLLGEMKVTVAEGCAKITGTETLAGASAPIDSAIRHFLKCTNCKPEQALEMASTRPAKLLGIYPQKGSLEIGADADFVILNQRLEVQKTYVNGESTD